MIGIHAKCPFYTMIIWLAFAAGCSAQGSKSKNLRDATELEDSLIEQIIRSERDKLVQKFEITADQDVRLFESTILTPWEETQVNKNFRADETLAVISFVFLGPSTDGVPEAKGYRADFPGMVIGCRRIAFGTNELYVADITITVVFHDSNKKPLVFARSYSRTKESEWNRLGVE